MARLTLFPVMFSFLVRNDACGGKFGLLIHPCRCDCYHGNEQLPLLTTVTTDTEQLFRYLDYCPQEYMKKQLRVKPVVTCACTSVVMTPRQINMLVFFNLS